MTGKLAAAILRKKRAAPKSSALFALLLGALLSGEFFALLFFSQSLIRPPVCVAYRLTGLYCLTCGGTRAANRLAHFHLLESLEYNPAPFLIALMVISAILFYFVNIIRGKDRPYRFYFVWLYTILGILIVWCVLRNVGILPELLTS